MKFNHNSGTYIVIFLMAIVFGSGFVLDFLQSKHIDPNSMIGPIGIGAIVCVLLFVFRSSIAEAFGSLRSRYSSIEEEISFPQEAYMALPPVLEAQGILEDNQQEVASSEDEQGVPTLDLGKGCPLPVTSAFNHHLLLEQPTNERKTGTVATRLYLEALGMLQVPQLVVALNSSYMTLLEHFPFGWLAGSPQAKEAYLPQLETLSFPKAPEGSQMSSMRYAIVREDNARPLAQRIVKHGLQVVLDLSTFEDTALAGRILVRMLTGMREYAQKNPSTCVVTLTQANRWVPSPEVLQSGQGLLSGQLARYLHETILSFVSAEDMPGFSMYLQTPTISDMDLRAVRQCVLWTLNRVPDKEDIPFLCHHADLDEGDLEVLAYSSLLCDITTLQAMAVKLHRHRSAHNEPEVDTDQHPGVYTGDLSQVMGDEVMLSLGKSSARDDLMKQAPTEDTSLAANGGKAFSVAVLAYAACMHVYGQLTRNALRRPPTNRTVGDFPVTWAELAHELGIKGTFSFKDMLSWDQTEALEQAILQLDEGALQVHLQLAQAALTALISRKESVASPVSVAGGATTSVTTRALSYWTLPPLSLFIKSQPGKTVGRDEVFALARTLQTALDGFKVYGRVQEQVQIGPRVLRFSILPTGAPLLEEGEVVRNQGGVVYKSKTKIADIVRIKTDLQATLRARSLRMLDPIAGTPYVGVEIPNPKPVQVRIREVLEDAAYQQACMRSKLVFALGRDLSGNVVFIDLNDPSNPHLLIAGSTGGGKSVCLNTVCASILSQATPDDVRFLMIDPKQVELVAYNGIPHLIGKVVTDPDKAVTSLSQTVTEMEKRYRTFSENGVKDIKAYNSLRATQLANGNDSLKNLPAIVVVIDELGNLMELAGETIERLIIRLASLGRAAGIHLVVATQRPTADVVTGNIKMNITARIAFLVPDQVNSRVILDQGGAELLQGKGDMLFQTPDSSEPARTQCALTEDSEVYDLIHYWKQAQTPTEIVNETVEDGEVIEEAGTVGADAPEELLIENSKESAIQRESLEQLVPAFLRREPLPIEVSKLSNEDLYLFVKPWVCGLAEVSNQDIMFTFSIGQPRAARLMQWLQSDGIVGPNPGAGRKRPVLANTETLMEGVIPVNQ